jgi:hypothetical protein
MNAFAHIVKFLDGYKDTYEFHVGKVTASAKDSSPLSADELKEFGKVSARALAAATIREHIDEFSREEERPRLIRKVQSLMDSALHNEDTHLASIGVFNEVLKALREEY